MQELFVQIFNRDLNDTGTDDLLFNIIKEYPYFSIPHFYLLNKTDNTDPAYENIAAKTALHFDNHFLLNYRLNKNINNKTENIDNENVNINNIEVEKVEVQEEKTKKNMEEITAKVNNEEMIFEPLFASDYFASQGIKLSEDLQSGDKLGKQLKSFTEWLKGMKKIHENKESSVSEQIDLAVQHLAEKSNIDANIITESMAEAYLQQGKMKKARETFEKLSLINPAKSAYFAAKIESIARDH